MLKQSLNLIPARPDLYQAKLVFYLFIGSLGMFFIAGLVTYCIVRTQAFRIYEPEKVHANVIAAQLKASEASDLTPDQKQALAGVTSDSRKQINFEPLSVPATFWTSTALLVFVSVFLQRAVWLVQRERQIEFRRWLVWALCAATVFIFIQSFGMYDLLVHHFSKSDGSTKVYGMSFTMALVHALHVLGGMIFLGFVIRQAFKNRYDHERHWPVDHCASYWHFLDVVWVCMLVMFVVTK